MQDVRLLFSQSPPHEHLIIARDLAHTEVPWLAPEEPLADAMERFAPQGLHAMPVVDKKAGGKIVGMLRRDAVTAYYNRRLLDRISES